MGTSVFSLCIACTPHDQAQDGYCLQHPPAIACAVWQYRSQLVDRSLLSHAGIAGELPGRQDACTFGCCIEQPVHSPHLQTAWSSRSDASALLNRGQVVIRVPGHREDVNAAAWADDSGQLMLSGSDDRMVKVRPSPAGACAASSAERTVVS